MKLTILHFLMRTLSYDRFQVVRGAAATVTNVVASGTLVHNRTLVHALLHTPFQIVGCAVATLTNAMASGDPFLNRTGVPSQVVRGAAATVTNAMASGDLVHNRTRVPFFQIDYNCTGMMIVPSFMTSELIAFERRYETTNAAIHVISQPCTLNSSTSS